MKRFLEKCGWSQNQHSYSDESDIANAKMKIHKFAGIIKLIKENNLIVGTKSYKDVYQALKSGFNGNLLGGASPCTLIPYNDSLWEQFFSEIEDVMGEGIPEELKGRFTQLRNISCEKDKEEEERIGHKQIVYGEKAFLTILGEVSEYCLEPYRENYLRPIMDEYISQYRNLMQEFSTLPPEKREDALQKLASSLSEEFFASDKISQTFFDKLQEQGLLTEDDKTAISVILQQGDIGAIKSEDMRKFIESHRKGTTDLVLVSRILSKKIEDDVLYGKKVIELTDEEKQTLKYKIKDLSIKSKNGYTIAIPYERFNENYEMEDAVGECSPCILAQTDEAETLLGSRLRDVAHFCNVTEELYETDFKTIQDSETIGQYLARMKQCVSLISRFIDGEKVQFNEYGELSNGNTPNLLQSYSNMGISSSDVEKAYGILTNTKEKKENKETTKNQGSVKS